MFAQIFVYWVALLALACGVANAAEIVPLPDADPFYLPPAGFESAPLGTVFRNRTIPSPAWGVSGVQLLYRTSGVQATQPTVTVATVLYMKNYNRSQLVAFSFPEDAIWTGCAPSYSLRSGNGSLIVNVVQTGLNNGWPIVLPDYEGVNSTFAAGRLEGHQVLDSLRAAQNFKPLGISPNAVMGGYGYSGGAISSGWAAQLQKNYAPELNIAGWAFGGTPSNLTATLLYVSNSSFSGLGFVGLFGMFEAYPEIAALWDKYATPLGKSAITKYTRQCIVDNIFSDGGKDVLSYDYCTIGSNFLHLPAVAAVLTENTMGLVASEVPISPVFIYNTYTDHIVAYPDVVRTYKAWCAMGSPATTNVQFITVYGTSGHSALGFGYEGPPVKWLNGRLRGVPLLKPGCFQTWDLSFGPPLAHGAQNATQR